MIGFGFVVLCATVIVCTPAEEARSSKESSDTYTNKFNNFDLNAVLNNRRVLSNYVKCLVGEGSCTKEGRELKKVIPDAIRTECEKCDETQKAAAVKVLKFLEENRPELLKKLMDKFDPEHVYEKKIRERIAKMEANTSKLNGKSV
ncbi:hypothetical protein PGB90_001036 [Kerria lacca]